MYASAYVSRTPGPAAAAAVEEAEATADMRTPARVCVAVQGLPRPDSVPNGTVSVSKRLRLTPSQTLRQQLFMEADVYSPGGLHPQILRPLAVKTGAIEVNPGPQLEAGVTDVTLVSVR